MIEKIKFKMSCGEIYGFLYLPDNITCTFPIVILSHGLSLNHTFMKPYAEKLLKYNIASFIFDFRGGGYGCLSSGKISDMTLNSEVRDLMSVIDFIKSLKSIDNDRIYLAGHSQGGFVSSLVGAKRVSEIRALFLFAPAYVICDDVRETTKREKNVLNLMPEHTKDTYIKCAKNVNLYNDITDYNKCVYIFHGKMDSRVPISYSYEACKAYDNCKLIVFDNEEHRFSDKTKDVVVKKMSEVILK